jgi:hypothetical protein
VAENERIRHRCVFDHGDIRAATSFDPFTHVYMFSIGYVALELQLTRGRCAVSVSPHCRFPPALWVDLAEIWNRSKSSQFLVCYHGPKDIINSYEFEVELITQTSTSMHGSKEGHSAYVYRRSNTDSPSSMTAQTACDPLFSGAWRNVQSGLMSLHSHVSSIVAQKMKHGPSTRASRRENAV